METNYYDVRKIDCNWKTAFIYLKSCGTFIICISSLIMWLWGLTFYLEMRKSNHEFISLHISSSQSIAWRGALYKHVQNDKKWHFFNCSGWMLRLYPSINTQSAVFGINRWGCFMSISISQDWLSFLIIIKNSKISRPWNNGS